MEKKLAIEGMTCQSCVKRVKKIIEKYKGVTDAAVSLEAKEAVIRLADNMDIAPILREINEFGFTAREK